MTGVVFFCTIYDEMSTKYATQLARMLSTRPSSTTCSNDDNTPPQVSEVAPQLSIINYQLSIKTSDSPSPYPLSQIYPG
jgi:hypothetical protein